MHEPEFDFDNDSEQNILLKFESDRVREAAKTKFLSYLFVYYRHQSPPPPVIFILHIYQQPPVGLTTGEEKRA